jgi:hypothetical protein
MALSVTGSLGGAYPYRVMGAPFIHEGSTYDS